jgi:GTP cyclohydrolase IB
MKDISEAGAISIDPIADVQGSADLRHIPINKVGIKDIYHPVRIKERAGGEQHTVANFNMYVDLPHNFKGTHMSRFVEILNNHEREISVKSFRDMMSELTERLDAASGHIEMSFPVLRQQEGAGVGRAEPDGLQGEPDRRAPEGREHHLGEGRGAGHQPVPLLEENLRLRRPQPALARHHLREGGRLRVARGTDRLAEEEASCELFGILKRPDEKWVTERAYDNPKFVEDLVRDIAVRLNADERIRAYTVESENFESIHNHSAYALIERDKDKDGPLPR